MTVPGVLLAKQPVFYVNNDVYSSFADFFNFKT